MRSLQTAPFKQQLLAQRASSLQQLETLRGGVSRVEAAMEHLRQGEDSHAQSMSERELELILDDRETTELEGIEAALQRIEDGVYGACVECGCDIALARLQAAPDASRCIVCQSRLEQTRRSATGL